MITLTVRRHTTKLFIMLTTMAVATEARMRVKRCVSLELVRNKHEKIETKPKQSLNQERVVGMSSEKWNL